jgi:hypothetical protein
MDAIHFEFCILNSISDYRISLDMSTTKCTVMVTSRGPTRAFRLKRRRELPIKQMMDPTMQGPDLNRTCPDRTG